MKYKYCLVISQYRYSRHMFIVEIDEDFFDRARACVENLESIKRPDDYNGNYRYGDVEKQNDLSQMRSRHNVNDYGDIYFINANSVTALLGQYGKYKEDSRRESTGYQKKAIVEDISKHHNYEEIKNAVKKMFKII